MSRSSDTNLKPLTTHAPRQESFDRPTNNIIPTHVLVSIASAPPAIGHFLSRSIRANRLVEEYREEAREMGAADEIVVIVDEHNNVVGAAPRREMRAKRLPHRSTYILVFNPMGELYVQKRTMTKDVFPGYYDIASGGVVLAGESYEQGAERELDEEMGIRDVPLTRLFDFYFEHDRTRLWGCTFSCIYDGAIVLQEEEVESGAFMPVHEILRQSEIEPFTPDGMYVLHRYLGHVTA